MKKVSILLAFFALFSCAKDMPDNPDPIAPQPGDEVSVNIGWSVAGMTAGDETTRAAMNEAATRSIPTDMNPGGTYTDEKPTVENMWIIQFDGNTPASKMLGVPRFISREELPVLDDPNPYPLEISKPLVSVASPAYTLFVANIREGANYRWALTAESTFADVVTRVKNLADESLSWEDFQPNKTLLMSALVESPVQLGTNLEPVFTRNVAKVTLDLTLDAAAAAAGVEIVSVRMRNVQRGIVLADAALDEAIGVSASTRFPLDGVQIDYESEEANMTAAGANRKYSWYVPRNQQGVVTPAVTPGVKDKSGIAPMNATFFEITAVKKSGSNTIATSIFRVYPGANMTNDFNIAANRHYTVGLTVKDVGTDPSDTRVETFDAIVDYTGNGTAGASSNSFIVNPSPVGGMPRQYRISIDQVNRYWGAENAHLAGYGNNPLYVIGPDDRWEVDLVWSDLDGLYSGPGSTGSAGGITLANNNGFGAGVGRGPGQYFVLEVPADLPGAGNFVLGIKKLAAQGGDDRYLWSWHFWVTDYNPDRFEKTSIAAARYTYPVPGGQVERYGSPASGVDLWGPAGIYADNVMMDRSLGAVETFFTPDVYNAAAPFLRRGTLYYQFGRKDPFPATENLSPHPFATGAGPVSIAESVAYPWVFYTVPNFNWSNTVGIGASNILWNDPGSVTGNKKSIYDPCPPGWTVPVDGTWNDFNRPHPAGGMANALNPARDLGWSYGLGIGSETATVNGVRYWPGTTGEEPAEGRIWYPATGQRSVSEGRVMAVSTNGYSWSASTSSATLSFMFNYANGAMNTSTPYHWGSSFPVRCISE